MTAIRGRGIKNLKRTLHPEGVRARDRASLARLLGCSWQVLKNLEFKGEVVMHQDGYHVREVQILLIEREDERERQKSSREATAEKDESLIEWRKVNTAIAKLELDQKAGRLLTVESVADAFQSLGSHFRDRAKNAPGRLAIQCEGRSRSEIEKVLLAELTELGRMLQEVADGFELKTAAALHVAGEPKPSTPTVKEN